MDSGVCFKAQLSRKWK